MSKTGITCYRNGGCGPYEMCSCYECPASKSDYLQRDVKDYPPYLDYPKPRKPMTNAERIRGMSDEELAKLFVSGWFDGPLFTCPVKDVECESDISCDVCFLEWLKAPVEEGEE